MTDHVHRLDFDGADVTRLVCACRMLIALVDPVRRETTLRDLDSRGELAGRAREEARR